jgi:dolichol-phosphate mannosyltransferase
VHEAAARFEPKTAIIFPSFNERENIKFIVQGLSLCKSPLLIVICDDSGPLERGFLEKEVLAAKPANCSVVFNYSDLKSGRGEAVRRGILWTLDNFPGVEAFVEADCDGSHSAIAIMALIEHGSELFDVVVGSRYLAKSKIVGWSTSRKLQSRILNLAIPALLKLPLRDVTNGLRRYSRGAAYIAYRDPLLSRGFTHLTEVALRLRSSGATFFEVPIIFEERIHGKSSVGAKELKDSLLGLARIIRMAIWKK